MPIKSASQMRKKHFHPGRGADLDDLAPTIEEIAR
jgi:hypothetical protein